MTLAALSLARAREHLGVRETAVNVVPFAPRTVRRGKWIRVQGLEWCARFFVEMVWQAWAHETARSDYDLIALTWRPVRTLPPVGLRAAVSELCDDARQSRTLHVIGDGYEPQEGDGAVLARVVDGRVRNPLRGAQGHIGWYVRPGSEMGTALILSGNRGDAVTEEDFSTVPIVGAYVVAWIAMG